MRAGQDEAKSIPRAKPHLFLGCVWYQDVRKKERTMRAGFTPVTTHDTSKGGSDEKP
jgi:hypothetical protein